MSEEAALIDAAKDGSVAAFTDLVSAYEKRLLRFLRTRCVTHADAEDALQDTMVNAWRYLATYDKRWRFSTWLFRIAINNAARQREPGVEPVSDVADPGADPLAACIAASDRENLWLSAKKLLNDEVYTAMWLRYVEDMSVRDVARALGRTNVWTRVNLHRGRQALSAELNASARQEEKAYG